MSDVGQAIRNRVTEMRVIPASKLQGRDGNWRLHPRFQRDALRGILETIGIAGALTAFHSEVQGGLTLIDGHLRKEDYPDTGWPVLILDVDDAEADVLLATLDPIAALAEAESSARDALLKTVETESEAVKALLERLAEDTNALELSTAAQAEHEAIKGQQPNPRELPLDVIYTLDMADCTCCLAVQAGLGYGFRSAQHRVCPYVGMLSGRHEIVFIDNDFKDYQHERHMQIVRKHRPKYATVRDIMSEHQCKEAGIEFYSFGQIMHWAEELEKYVESVIVIPKLDCLDAIPERYVLGYSVPTSYGGTPIPAERFRGRCVHLLGGSWKAQLEYLALLGDDVVSLDTNYVQLIAKKWAQFVTPEGRTMNLTEEGYPWLTNPRSTALALSFGAIGAKINELYAGNSNPA